MFSAVRSERYLEVVGRYSEDSEVNMRRDEGEGEPSLVVEGQPCDCAHLEDSPHNKSIVDCSYRLVHLFAGEEEATALRVDMRLVSRS